MKIQNLLLTAFAIFGLVLLTTPATQAQTCDGTGSHFIDLNGDGFNDNAPDHDGDGIPNGLDPDWIKYAQDGTGYQLGSLGANQGIGMAQTKTMTKAMTKTQKFNKVQAFEGNMFQKRLGALGGSSGSGAGVCDGSGGGSAGSGICDGTGPNGTQRRGGK
jgi:hypothetical protein